MDPLVLTFDIGTQSMRALLVNSRGEIEGNASYTYPEPYLPSEVFGQAEQIPDFYYEGICSTALKLKNSEKGKELFKRIQGVTIACIRDSVLLVDKNNKPLRNLILWLDERRASSVPNPPLWQKAAFKIVGMTETVKMLYQNSFYNWIREHEDKLWKKTSKFIFLSGYMTYKLTGEMKDSVANQVGHVPFDNKKRKWMDKGLSRCVADIPKENLIDLVESAQIIGRINKETADKSGIPEGTPLFASGTDKASEALGLSVIGDGKAAISLGSAATIQFCSPKYFEPEPFLPSYPSIIPGYYNSEYQIYRGYWTLTWFKNEFCQAEAKTAEENGCAAEAILDEYLEEVPPGCNGLVITPHLSPGAGNPFAKGVIEGLSDKHTKKHMYRAIIEGIDFELLMAMKRMERRSGLHVDELYVGGGGSKSDIVVQIAADIFGKPVKRIQTHEATAIGSAMSGFVGLGVFPDYQSASASMSHEGKVFKPNMKRHKVYMDIFDNVYCHIEKVNTGLFKKLKRLAGVATSED